MAMMVLIALKPAFVDRMETRDRAFKSGWFVVSPDIHHVI